MKRSFQCRELFSLYACGLRLHGTYHAPNQSTQNPTGVLLLTGLSTPRAAHGDSGVDWAESFATGGYPTFRVDLPGSGDSEEGSYAECLSLVNAGGHGPVVTEMVSQLTKRYGLTGMVIMGHCAGAISALFAAVDCPQCRGLVLLAPYFHLPQPLGLKARRSLIDWATRNRFAGLLSHLYLRTANMRPLFRRHAPPGNTNLALLARWKQLMAASLPMLVLEVPGPRAASMEAKAGEFNYFAYLALEAGGKSRLEVTTVESSHHTFANQAGRTGVQQHVESWLSTYFPLEGAGQKPANTGKTAQQAAIA